MSRERPDFLRTNGVTFALPSVVGSYLTRPAYPEALLAATDSLAVGDGPVLELGCGPGLVARDLASRGRQVVAVDPSEGMIALAQSLSRDGSSKVRWICSSAEDFDYADSYGLVAAVMSLHWMEWDVVMPAIRRSLAPGARLAIVTANPRPVPWGERLTPLIAEYSTIRNWVAHDLLDLLVEGGYFVREGTATFDSTWESHVEAYVESFHARSGFAREWMGEERAEEFDTRLRALLAEHGVESSVRIEETYVLTWGRPTG